MIAPTLKALFSPLVAAMVVAFALGQRHFGFLVVFLLPFLVPWLIMSAWVCFRNPQKRRLQAAKMGIWFLSIAIVISVHAYMAIHTRANAQKIVNAVTVYYASHGAYPKNIQQFGYSKEELKSMIGMGGYFFSGNDQPSFFYASTYIPFEVDSYDFSKREWEHRD